MTIIDAYSNDWLSMDIEEILGVAWVHLNISEWNKTRARQLPAAIKECEEVLREYEYDECYICVLKSDTTLRKFLIMVGCEPHIDAGHLVPAMEVWKRKL